MSVKCILQGQKQEVPEVTLEFLGAASATSLTSHVSDKNNPHGVTTAQIGAVNKAGDTMTGNLVTNGQITAAGGFVGNLTGNATTVGGYTVDQILSSGSDWEKVASASFNAVADGTTFTGNVITLLAAGSYNFNNVTDIMFTLTNFSAAIHFPANYDSGSAHRYCGITDPLGQGYVQVLRAKSAETTPSVSGINCILSRNSMTRVFMRQQTTDNSFSDGHYLTTPSITGNSMPTLQLNEDGTNATNLQPSIALAGYNISPYKGSQTSGTITMYIRKEKAL